jgi:hypothetical protein
MLLMIRPNEFPANQISDLLVTQSSAALRLCSLDAYSHLQGSTEQKQNEISRRYDIFGIVTAMDGFHRVLRRHAFRYVTLCRDGKQKAFRFLLNTTHFILRSRVPAGHHHGVSLLGAAAS